MVLIVFNEVAERPAHQPSGRIGASVAAKIRITELEQESQKLREEMQSSQEDQRGVAISQRGARIN